MYRSENPYTQQCLATAEYCSETELNDVLDRLNQSFQEFRFSSLQSRLDLVTDIADTLEAISQDCARQITLEMGKPIQQSVAEIKKSVGLCRYYVKEAETLLQSVQSSSVYLDPLGIILAIMPWNFPIWQVFRVLIPQLIVGNVLLFKHAPTMTGLTQLLMDAYQSHQEFSFARLSYDQVDYCIQHPAISGVTLTGSVRAGKTIAQLAGSAVKPSVLELGGSDAFIVCEDADLELAVQQLIVSRFQNCGQSCIAAKRLLVHESIKDDVIARLIQHMSQFRYGDPLQEDTTLGPLASREGLVAVQDQLKRGTAQAATILYQADISLIKTGYFFPATLVELLSSDNCLWQEEVFGPVLSCMTFKTDQEAIALANDSSYGLGASVWTAAIDRQTSFISQLQVGMVALNKCLVSVYDRPFGGIKQSGYGHELALEGCLSFVNKKQVL